MIDDPTTLLPAGRAYTRVTAKNRKLMETVMLAKLVGVDPATLKAQTSNWVNLFPADRERVYFQELGMGEMPIHYDTLRNLPEGDYDAVRSYLLTGLVDSGLAVPSPITDPVVDADPDFELVPPANRRVAELYLLSYMAGIEPEDLRARSANWIRMFPGDRELVSLANLANVTGEEFPDVSAIDELDASVLDSITTYLLSSVFRCYDAAQGTYFDVNSSPSNIVYRWNYPAQANNWLVWRKKLSAANGSTYVVIEDYRNVAFLAGSARSYLDPQTIPPLEIWYYKVQPLQTNGQLGPFLAERAVAYDFHPTDSAVAGTPMTNVELYLNFGTLQCLKQYSGSWTKNNGIYLPNLRYCGDLALAYGTRGTGQEYAKFQTANFPELLTCDYIYAFSSTLSAFLAKKLQTAGQIFLQASWMSQLDLTALKQASAIVISFNIAANAPPFNSLPMLRVINLPNLERVTANTAFDFFFNAEGAALNFRSFGSLDIRHPTLTSFRFPKFIFQNNQQFNIHGNELGADSVDHILERAFNSPALTGAVITITDPTNPNGYDDLNAPPSEVGWKYKVSLVNAGNTVKVRNATFFPDPSKFVWTARNSGGNTLVTLQSYSGPAYFDKINWKGGPQGTVGANTGSALLSALPLTDVFSITGENALFEWQVQWVDALDAAAGVFCPTQTRSDILPMRVDDASKTNQIILNWSPYSGATAYNILRATDGDRLGGGGFTGFSVWRTVSALTVTDTEQIQQHQKRIYRLQPIVSGSPIPYTAQVAVCRQFYAYRAPDLDNIHFAFDDYTYDGATQVQTNGTFDFTFLKRVTGSFNAIPNSTSFGTLQRVNLPVLASYGSTCSINGNSVNTVTIPSLVFGNSQSFYAGSAPLNQATVDAILARGVASICKKCFFQLATSANGGGPCAPPSDQGFAYKQTLQARGNTVWTQFIAH